MSRYIDAEWLKVEFPHNEDWNYPVNTNSYVVEMIDEAPSIDIVFCRECKYEPICNHSVQHTTHEPTSVTIGSKTVEWCSYGERKE